MTGRDEPSFYLGNLVNESWSSPLRVAAVRVEGASRTRDSFLDWLFRPHLSSLAGVYDLGPDSTVQSVLRATRTLSTVLLETDIFSAVQPRIELSKDLLSKYGDVDIVFRTKEKKKWFLRTSTELGENGGSASLQARVQNVFGGAETFDASIGLGTRTRRYFNTSLTAPLSTSLKSKGQLLAFSLERDCSGYASYSEVSRGVKAIIRSVSQDTTNELMYEAISRQICNLHQNASLSIREAAGHTFKSSLSHTWIHDTRNDVFQPSRGLLVRLVNELAGLGGDSAFYKAQAFLHTARPIFDGATISFSARAGILWPFFSKSVPLLDRFHLGGPLVVRMFRENSLGPKDGADSLGGDFLWATGLSLLANVPRKPHWPVKLHAFINAGKLDELNHIRKSENKLITILQPSASVGFGLMYRLDSVRVEFNFGVPLFSDNSDGYRRGFQFGLGIDCS